MEGTSCNLIIFSFYLKLQALKAKDQIRLFTTNEWVWHQCKTTSHYEALELKTKDSKLWTPILQNDSFALQNREICFIYQSNMASCDLWTRSSQSWFVRDTSSSSFSHYSMFLMCKYHKAVLPIDIMHIYLPEYKHCSKISTGWHGMMDGWMVLSLSPSVLLREWQSMCHPSRSHSNRIHGQVLMFWLPFRRN